MLTALYELFESNKMHRFESYRWSGEKKCEGEFLNKNKTK